MPLDGREMSQLRKKAEDFRERCSQPNVGISIIKLDEVCYRLPSVVLHLNHRFMG